MAPNLTFDDSYAEHLRLPSGEQLRIRLIRPTDKERLRRAFAELSPQSRQKRFLASKEAISDAELRYFTELDHLDHFAIGAIELGVIGNEDEGVGIGRFVRLPKDPKCAEVAITVTDRMQGKGVGRRLLERLANAARERDIERFRFECLPCNLEMQRLVQRVCQVRMVVNEDGVMVAEADVPPPTPSAAPANSVAGLVNAWHRYATETWVWQFEFSLRTLQQGVKLVLLPETNR